MRIALGLAIALFAHGLECRAGDVPRLLSEADLARRAARVTMFVPPDYPAQALREGVEATVDVTGVVAANGSLRVTGMTSSVDREDFRTAVGEVTRFWILSPKYGPDCRPRDVEGTVRVWFELKEGKPAISMSMPRRQGTDAAKNDGTELRPLRARPIPQYPRAALTKNIQGGVDALLRIAPAGDVEEVVIVPGLYAEVFADVVIKALSRWQFPPASAAAGPRCGFVPVEINIKPGF
ncbi:MAG: energy transducer TonB [Usitatibacter sp.]